MEVTKLVLHEEKNNEAFHPSQRKGNYKNSCVLSQNLFHRVFLIKIYICSNVAGYTELYPSQSRGLVMEEASQISTGGWTAFILRSFPQKVNWNFSFHGFIVYGN